MFSDRRYQGLLPYFVTSFLLVLMSFGILCYYLTHFGANQLYSQGKILSRTAPTGNLAVQVIYIHPKSVPLKERGTNLYLIGYADSKDRIAYIGLEAKENDGIIKRLYRDNKVLIDSSYRLEAELLAVGQGFERNLFDSASRKVIKPDSSLGQEMDRQRIASLSLAKRKKHQYYLFSLIFCLMGIICFSYAYRLKIRNNKALEDFYDHYPELDASLDKAESYASFILAKYDLLIYKTHLLTYGRDIRLLDLNQLLSLKQAKKTFQHSTSNEQDIPLPILEVTLANGSKANLRLKKIVPMDLTDLLIYLNRYFPDIKTVEGVQPLRKSQELLEDVEEESTLDTEEELVVDLEDLD